VQEEGIVISFIQNIFHAHLNENYFVKCMNYIHNIKRNERKINQNRKAVKNLKVNININTNIKVVVEVVKINIEKSQKKKEVKIAKKRKSRKKYGKI